MNATRLRNLMLVGIGLTMILIGVVIYYASSFLRDETIKNVHTKIDRELSSQDLDRLKNLQRVLQENRSSVQKAEQIVAATKQYQYQDQIIRDVNSYANSTGVKVTAYDFASANKPGAVPNQPTVSGVKSIAVTLTLDSPMSFDNYLRFIKAIEQNLTKMQISGVNLSPDIDNVNNIANPSIGLVVYVR
jgi:hypothetical protein